MRTPTILLAAALGSACMTQNNAALVITKVVPPTATSTTTGTTTTTTCTFVSSSAELTFIPVNLTENVGYVAAVVKNTITQTTNYDPTLAGDTSMFLPHQAVVTYDFPANPNGAPPAGVTVQSPSIIPVTSVTIPGGADGTIGIPMFLPGVVTGAVPAGTFIRVTFDIEGKLLSGGRTHTSQREYLFQVCTTAGCGLNVCL